MTSSSDEGEIVENGTGDLKATSLPRAEGSGVDRQDRLRNRNPSPDVDSASRYSNSSSRRSRSPRGHKRPRDSRDASYQYGGHREREPRPSRGHYRDSSYGDEPRRAYDDLDQPAPRASNLSYDRHHDRDRDRDHPSERPRDRHRQSSRERDRRHERDRQAPPDKRPRHSSRSPSSSRRVDLSRGKGFVTEGHFDRRAEDNARGLRYDDNGSSQQGRAASRLSRGAEAPHRSLAGRAKPDQTVNGHDP